MEVRGNRKRMRTASNEKEVREGCVLVPQFHVLMVIVASFPDLHHL